MNTFFRFKQFVVHQERTAMKVGTDGVLLGALATPADDSEPHRILDIGTGTGLIALMMAQRYSEANVTGIDIDSDAVGQAFENCAASPFAERIKIEQADAAAYALVEPYDLIVSNPPYFSESLKCPDGQRTLARHTVSLDFDTLMAAADRLLSCSGTMAVIVPSDLIESLTGAARSHGLHISSTTDIYTNSKRHTQRCVIHFTRRQREEPSHSETVLLNDDGSMTTEYKEMTAAFYLG